MNRKHRAKVYEYLRSCGFVMTGERHYNLKKLLNPELTEEEIEEIVEDTIVDEE